jgi:nucleoside-diphosphate-sugar epimerase
MNAAVTGGNGFLGSALVKALLQRGDQVRTLVRREPAAAEMRALGAQPLIGDLTNPDSCQGLVETGDVVFHAAARVDMTGRWEEFQRTTIDGTRNLLAAALPRCPRRFVHVSSAAVYSPAAPPGGLRADRTPTRPAAYNFYGRSKLAAERLVQSECERSGCPWTILRLGFLFGPGNRALLNHLVPLAKRNRLFIIGSGRNRIATLFLDDAVRATVLAATRSAATRSAAECKVYDVASDEPVTQREFIDATTDALGLPRVRRHISRSLALAGAWLIERLSSWADHEPHICRSTVALMSADQVLDASRIRADLDWRPEVSFAEGMHRTRQWHRRLSSEPSVGSAGNRSAPAAHVVP